MSSDKFYQQIEQRFIKWGQEQADVHVAYVAGSRARLDHGADEYSDLDIQMYVDDPKRYLESNSWIENFGKLNTAIPFQNGGGGLEWLALFEGGYQVDFVIDSLTAFQAQSDKGVPLGWFLRGARVLLDKTGNAQRLIPEQFERSSSSAITEESFDFTVNMFWFLAIYLAKQILRNELWTVKLRDVECKQVLLQTVEWYEKLEHGEEFDTWHAGRFIYEWVDDDIFTRLNGVFGRFDAADSWRALQETIDLYELMSRKLAAHYQYTYPEALVTEVKQWIEEHGKIE